MRIKHFFFLAMGLASVISSCGGNNKSAENSQDGLTPKTETVSGLLGKYFKVLNKAYPLQKELGVEYVYIELERIKEGLPDPWTDRFGTKVGTKKGEIEPSLTIEFYDKSGRTLGKSSTQYYSNSKPVELQQLIDLQKGETSTIQFYVSDDVKKADPVQFKVYSNFECHFTGETDEDVFGEEVFGEDDSDERDLFGLEDIASLDESIGNAAMDIFGVSDHSAKQESASAPEESVTVDLSSEVAFIKSATSKLTELKKRMDAAKSGREFRLVLADYNDFIDLVPDNINQKYDSEIMELEGGEAYLDAIDAFMRSYYRAKDKYGEDYF